MGDNDPHAGPGLSTLGSEKKTWTSLAALLWQIYSRVWQIYLWLVSSWVSLSLVFSGQLLHNNTRQLLGSGESLLKRF